MRRGTIYLVLSAVLVVVALALAGGQLGATGSALSRGPSGLLAMRLYLEASQTRVDLLDRPELPEKPEDVLVLAFPWQRRLAKSDLQLFASHLRRGGTVMLAYSGDLTSFRESDVISFLGLELTQVRDPPPLTPWKWWRYHRQEWQLRPASKVASEPVVMQAIRAAPQAHDAARVRFRAPDDTPLVFEFDHLGGRVVVLPGAIFSNARLGQAGNADLLATLRAQLGRRWTFDEFHHGLSVPGRTRPGHLPGICSYSISPSCTD